MLDNIRIVLVRTFHPGNIGSAARSMKTMGLTDLALVAPRDFPSEEAVKMAAGATDMVANARTFDTLPEAIADCTTVIASTARPRGYDLPELDPEAAASLLVQDAQKGPVALIFGPERMGLHNQDIKHAKYRVTIPANPQYSSLNMAAAVQTLAYEVYKAATQGVATNPVVSPPRDLPTSADIERFYGHLEQVLGDIQFLRPHQGETMQRLRHLFTRAEPDVLELNILRGILSAIDKTRSQP
ncbi:tRNA (cytidine/uridine-2'-O-)-methyltransferase TrmJ [Arenicella chitinivorans]|uniref:tRNA (cytidine/uridine-2'-O-)-methyltransferase TrmJ n=1 Tax=Arenicella chitinivorans TaxID=1329800 RepID=A0A918RLE5_9GAMM|nr:RNA methyltransferase [Arenicella chitinivorans]GHA04790.1 tRNA (cytidine/uridine-2'-O-)-methyltransferase TrmJ [Arenicella chitinivorans]